MGIPSEKSGLYWLCAAHFVTDNYPGFIAPMLPFIAGKIDIPMASAMLIISIANITSYLLQPVFGFLSDKITRRFFIFWGILIAAIFIPAMGLVTNFLWLALVIVIGEIGVGFFHPQATGFVPSLSKDQSQTRKDLSLFLSLGTVGFATGALISTKIYDVFGSEALMFTSFFGILFAFTMFMFLPKIPKSTDIKEKVKISLTKCVKSIIFHPVVRILVVASILKSLIVSSFSMILPFYWKSVGLSATSVGALNCTFLISSTLGMLTSPHIEKKIGTRNLFYLSFMSILPLALIFMFSAQSCKILSYVCFVLTGFLGFLTVPVNLAVSQKLLPEFKNLISGVIGGFSWGIIGVMLPLLSLFAEKIGILQALCVISTVPFLFFFAIRLLPEKLTENN